MSSNRDKYNLIFKWPDDSLYSGYDILCMKCVRSTSDSILYHSRNLKIYHTAGKSCTDNSIKALNCRKNLRHEAKILISNNTQDNESGGDLNKYKITDFKIEKSEGSDFVSIIRSTSGGIDTIKYRGTKSSNIDVPEDKFAIKINDCTIYYVRGEWKLKRKNPDIGFKKKSIGSKEYLNISSDAMRSINMVGVI